MIGCINEAPQVPKLNVTCSPFHRVSSARCPHRWVSHSIVQGSGAVLFTRSFVHFSYVNC